ncbi:MAG: hypothetical protein QOF77_152 [Solirubrobacteraceae bacterium]|nr:hypothetical protein [Solirubrobacteraceae bacterium]
MTAADRFRAAVERRDLDAMAGALAPDVRLHSPTLLAPIEGRDRARKIFGVLEELFEDFEYTRVLAGGPADRPEESSTHALMFRCRIGSQQIEGIDVLDLDDDDQIAELTVLVRPLAGLQALAEQVAARLAARPG